MQLDDVFRGQAFLYADCQIWGFKLTRNQFSNTCNAQPRKGYKQVSHKHLESAYFEQQKLFHSYNNFIMIYNKNWRNFINNTILLPMSNLYVGLGK